MNATDKTFIPLTDVQKNLLVLHGEVASRDDVTHIEIVEGAPNLVYLVFIDEDSITDVGASGGAVQYSCYDHPIEAFID